MTPALPQELFDHIVDLSHNDKRTLLVLLKSARVFGERCRMYIYRVARLRAKTYDELRHRWLALDDLLATCNTGRFVFSLHYQFIPSIPSIIDIPSAVPAFALLMPNVRELQLEGNSFELCEDFDWSHLMPNPKSIIQISLSGCYCTADLARLMRTCPSLASLAFVSASARVNPGPIGDSHSAAAGPSIGQLALIECDAVFLELISSHNLNPWSGLHRLSTASTIAELSETCHSPFFEKMLGLHSCTSGL